MTHDFTLSQLEQLGSQLNSLMHFYKTEFGTTRIKGEKAGEFQRLVTTPTGKPKKHPVTLELALQMLVRAATDEGLVLKSVEFA